MKKKVLFVVDERQMGGVSAVLEDLLHLLDHEKFDVDVLVLHDRGDRLQNLPANVRVFFGTPFFRAIDCSLKGALHNGDLGLLVHKLRLIFLMKTGRIAKKIMKERRKLLNSSYDVEVAFKDGFCALFSGYGDTPIKLHWLHSSYRYDDPTAHYTSLFETVLPRFTKIIAVSHQVERQFQEIYHLENKTVVIAPPIDVTKIKQEMAEAPSCELTNTCLQMAAVGRLHPLKGFDRLLDVIALMKREGLMEQVQVHIFGDGEEREQLRQQCKALGLEQEVIWEGACVNVAANLKYFDLLLMPSYAESFGLVMLEAFLCGVPVLATRTAGSEMLMTDDRYGCLCENSREGFANGLRRILRQPALLTKWKAGLKNYQYDYAAIMKQIESLLNGECV